MSGNEQVVSPVSNGGDVTVSREPLRFNPDDVSIDTLLALCNQAEPTLKWDVFRDLNRDVIKLKATFELEGKIIYGDAEIEDATLVKANSLGGTYQFLRQVIIQVAEKLRASGHALLAPKVNVVISGEVEEVARKIKISKPAPRAIDPAKVKKPHCPIHTSTQMEYDSITGKWRCTTDGCSQVATPKAAPEDNAITFGKGNIQTRLMYTDSGEAHVVLLADNNVALDVTDMFDVEQIEETFDVDENAKTVSNGRDEFLIPSPRKVTYKAPLFVMGSRNKK